MTKKIYIKIKGEYFEIVHEKNLARSEKERNALRKKRQYWASKKKPIKVYKILGGVYYLKKTK